MDLINALITQGGLGFLAAASLWANVVQYKDNKRMTAARFEDWKQTVPALQEGASASKALLDEVTRQRILDEPHERGRH